MTTEAKGGIIIARHMPEAIELVPLRVDFDQTVQEAVNAKYLSSGESDLIAQNFDWSKRGQTGVNELTLVLVRLVPTHQSWKTDKVLFHLDEAGFIPEDMPALTTIIGHADELYEKGISYVTALGGNSRWQDPDGGVCVPYVFFDLDRVIRLSLYCLEEEWRDEDWFVARRK